MENLKQQGLEIPWETLHRRATMQTDKNLVSMPPLLSPSGMRRAVLCLGAAALPPAVP